MKPSKTTIDWLRFRSKGEPRDVLQAILPMYPEDLREAMNIEPTKGILGFAQGATIRIANMPIGRMDYGGEHMREWVRTDLTGKGCSFVNDWDAVRSVEALPRAELRRLDIALTTWRGEIDHARVVQAHAAGGFTTSGRPPVLQQITSSDDRAGRTCYIGNRKGDKFARCYEKGFQMMSGLSTTSSSVWLEGADIEDIYRCEIELKPVTTSLDWEVLERRDQYFAGAYPFFGEILPGIEPDILQRRPEREPQRDLAVALANLKTQYGATLFTALAAYKGDFLAVWDKVVGDKHNTALLEAGVLLVDHD